MRHLAFIVVAACGGGEGAVGLEVDEASCQPGRFHFVHDLALSGGIIGGEGDLTTAGFSFVNAGIQDQNGNVQNGSLAILQGGSGTSSIVTIEFQDLLPDGGTVDARGSITLDQPAIEAGNCETAGFTGRLTEIGNGWKFTLVELHASPFCSGAAVSGSFAGCTRSSN